MEPHANGAAPMRADEQTKFLAHLTKAVEAGQRLDPSELVRQASCLRK
jgi:hypothetical protein